MPVFKDFTFNKSVYGKTEEYEDAGAIILAVKNILLTRKGNYPGIPNFGMNIEKYQFDILDDQTIQEIQNELEEQINKYIPVVGEMMVTIEKVEDDFIENKDAMLGITLTTEVNSEPITSRFLLYKDFDILKIINETN